MQLHQLWNESLPFSKSHILYENHSFQANCIDSTAEAEAVFAGEVNKLKSEKIKPREQITLEPYERDHAVVVGEYRYKMILVFVVQIAMDLHSENDEIFDQFCYCKIHC